LARQSRFGAASLGVLATTMGWPAVGRLRFKADLPAMVREPSGAGAQNLVCAAPARRRWEAEEFAQLGHEASLIAFSIIQNHLHGD